MFKNLFISLFRRGSSNLLKILLLGVGIAFGCILIAKIYYEQSFDGYLDNHKNIYQITSNFDFKDGDKMEMGQTSGAIAPGLKEYSPAVSQATRFMRCWDNLLFQHRENDGSFSGGKVTARKVLFADTAIFSVFNRDLTGSDPVEMMNIAGNAYISRSFARKLAGDEPIETLLNTRIAPPFWTGATITVCGIYDDFPLNSTLAKTDVLVSLPSTKTFSFGESGNSWYRNFNYSSYVVLHKNADLKDVQAAIEKMCSEKLPHKEMEENGIKMVLKIIPIQEFYTSKPEVKRTTSILLIFAIMILLVSTLNYLLVSISSMIKYSKVIAVQKCYGAQSKNIYFSSFVETSIHLLSSLLIALLLIITCKNMIEETIGTTLYSLLTTKSLFILLAVFLIIFILCFIITAVIYIKTPVSEAFRIYTERNQKWKYALLFTQFGASSFFIVLAIVIGLQYKYITKSDLGYKYDNLVTLYTGGMYKTKVPFIKEEIDKMPFVSASSLSMSLPYRNILRNTTLDPVDNKELLKVLDQECADHNFIHTFGIKLIEGKEFEENNTSSHEVLISRSFAEKMYEMGYWKDGAIGKTVRITGHPSPDYTVRGIYENITIGSFINNDCLDFPSILFYSKSEGPRWESWMETLTIKLSEMKPEYITAINDFLETIVADGEKVSASKDFIWGIYQESKRFKTSVSLAGIVVFIITIIGLLGYIQDEVNRKQGEIAVRKVLGGSVGNIIKLFLFNVLKLAVPAAVVGSILSYYVAKNWLEQFSKQIPLSFFLFLGIALSILFILCMIVTARVYKIANTNPSETIKR